MPTQSEKKDIFFFLERETITPVAISFGAESLNPARIQNVLNPFSPTTRTERSRPRPHDAELGSGLDAICEWSITSTSLVALVRTLSNVSPIQLAPL